MTIERVFVAGAGLMGHGIAQVHAAIGLSVVRLRARARAGRGGPRADRGQPRAGGRQGPARATPNATRRSAGSPWRTTRRAVRDADLVIEAVFEDVDVKTGPLARARSRSRRRRPSSPRTRARSRSSRLAEAVAPARRERFVGMHFFSPVPVMPLIELIRGPDDRRRDRGGHPGAGGPARQAGDRVGRPARLHRQPDPHAVPGRGDAGLRAGSRHGRRHRHRAPGSD